MQMIWQTYLVFYPKISQYFRKRRCKIHAGMRLRDLNNVEQKTHGASVALEVDSHSDEGLVVRRSPRVRPEAEGTIMFLDK
jgi:hypothetical protein